MLRLCHSEYSSFWDKCRWIVVPSKEDTEQILHNWMSLFFSDYNTTRNFGNCIFIWGSGTYETNRYDISLEIKQGIRISVDEIKICLGFLLFSGYPYYWSENDNLRLKIVKDATSRNDFLQFKSLIHFQDNSKAKHNKDDRGFKIRLLPDIINSKLTLYMVCSKSICRLMKYYSFLETIYKG